MNNLFEKNLTTLEKSFPHVYQVIQDLKKQSNGKLQLSLEQTKQGLINIKAQNENQKIYLHSNYDPDREITNILANHDFSEKDSIIVFGFGLGYHIERLIKDYTNKHIVIIDFCPQILVMAMENRDLTAIFNNKNITLLITDNLESISNNLSVFFNIGKISKVEFVELPSYNRLFSEFIQTIKKALIVSVRVNKANIYTEIACLEGWIRNHFANLKHITQSADLHDLDDKFKNVPAIMVSAGPSLNKNLALLKEIGDKALIVANGSTISILQKEGIKPHIMLGIDGHEKMSEIYTKVEWDDIVFAYILNLHPAALEHYKGPKVHIKTMAEPLVELMEQSINRETPSLISGGSCANIALDFVVKLGCNPVIMIGQDLAYTNMEIYAEGHDNKDTGKKTFIENRLLKKAIDIYGKDIYTSDSLLTMVNTFESYMAKQSDKQLFINATEGGLPIKGAKNSKFKDTIDLYCNEELNIKERLESLIKESTKKNTDLKDELLKYLESLNKYSHQLKELSDKRIKLIDQILGDIPKGKSHRDSFISKQMNQYTAELEKLPIFKKVINLLALNLLLFINKHADTIANNTEDLWEKLRILHEGLKGQFTLIDQINTFIGDGCEKAISSLRHEV